MKVGGLVGIFLLLQIARILVIFFSESVFKR